MVVVQSASASGHCTTRDGVVGQLTVIIFACKGRDSGQAPAVVSLSQATLAREAMSLRHVKVFKLLPTELR